MRDASLNNRDARASIVGYAMQAMEDAQQDTDRWPIFICYRQADGQVAAARIFSLLNEQPVPVVETGPAGNGARPPILDVYFDQAAPGVADWTAVHEPFLKRARAMILVCTPGAKLNEGKGDWVQHEIDWWLRNRVMAPILVDPLGQNLRYVPNAISERWPNAQRILLREADWVGLEEDARLALDQRAREQFLGAIVPSSDAFYRQELEQDRARTIKLQRTRRTMALLSVLLIGVLGVSLWIFMLKNEAVKARGVAEAANAVAQEARVGELAARELAEARLTENRAVRAATEARLFDYLQQFERFEAYLPEMQDWEKDFRQQATDLQKATQSVLPTCDVEEAFSVYERQLIGMEVAPDAGPEWLWFYLAVVPGQSPRPGDWAPAVLDVFATNSHNIEPGRELSRTFVKDQIRKAGVPNDKVWSFVVGLAGGNYLTVAGNTYKVSNSNIGMNDEGDMIMAFELCKEHPVGPTARQE